MQGYIFKKGFGFLLLISLFGLSGCGGGKVSSSSNVTYDSTDSNTTVTSTNDNNHTTIDDSTTTTTETGHTDEVNSTTETSTNDTRNDNSEELVLTKEQRLVADQFVSVFENSTTALQYGYAKNIGDGRGITAGRAGFTSATGDMMILIKDYLKIKSDAKLKKYLPELARLNELRYGEKKDKEASASTKNLRGLVGDWKEASKDENFRKVQDEVVDKLYYNPALKYAKELGLTYPLGVLALYDAIIVHGEGGEYGLKKLISQTNESFDTKSPKEGTDEMQWLKKFNEIRKDNYKKEGRDDDARINELLEMIKTGKYDLGPFDMKVNQWGDEEFKLGTPNVYKSENDYIEDDADYLSPMAYDDKNEKIIFENNFEEDFSKNKWEVTCYTNGDFSCDEDPFNKNGELNIIALQSYGGKKHERKEVITQKDGALLHLDPSKKYQIDIKLRLPTNRKPDVYETGGEILFQLHATDEDIDSPPLVLVVYGEYYYWYARNFYNAAQEQEARNNSIYNPTDKDEIEKLFKDGKVYKIDELKAEHGNAIHFHITIQLYEEDAKDGLRLSRRIKIEKEGKEMNILFERNKSSRLAKIAHIPFKGPQLGIYKWDWDADTYGGNITKRTVYYDNIKVIEAKN